MKYTNKVIGSVLLLMTFVLGCSTVQNAHDGVMGSLKSISDGLDSFNKSASDGTLFENKKTDKRIGSSASNEYSVIKVIHTDNNMSDMKITFAMIDDHLKGLNNNVNVKNLDENARGYEYYVEKSCINEKSSLKRLKNEIEFINAPSNRGETVAIKMASIAGQIEGYNSYCDMVNKAKGTYECKYAKNADDYLEIKQNRYDMCRSKKVYTLTLVEYVKFISPLNQIKQQNSQNTDTSKELIAKYAKLNVAYRNADEKAPIKETIYVVKQDNTLYYLVRNKNQSEILRLKSVNIDTDLKNRITNELP